MLRQCSALVVHFVGFLSLLALEPATGIQSELFEAPGYPADHHWKSRTQSGHHVKHKHHEESNVESQVESHVESQEATESGDAPVSARPWRPSPLRGSTPDLKLFKRVIYHDIHDKAGINDRLFVLTRMLAFATEVKAVLGFPTPDKMLGHRHGNTSASNWTEYYVIRPKVHTMDGIGCEPGVKEVTISDASFLKSMPSWLVEDLQDTDRPLCLRIKSKFNEIKVPKGQSSDIQKFMDRGARHMAVWSSGKVVELLKKTRRSNYILRRPYNVVHVRLGDKATAICSTPSYIVDKVEQMVQQNSEHGHYPWLIMSDGSDEFFAQLIKIGKKKDIRLFTEKEMRPLNQLDDNYLRYTVLECIFGGAELALSNFKDHGRNCKVPPHHVVPTRFIGC